MKKTIFVFQTYCINFIPLDPPLAVPKDNIWKIVQLTLAVPWDNVWKIVRLTLCVCQGYVKDTIGYSVNSVNLIKYTIQDSLK